MLKNRNLQISATKAKLTSKVCESPSIRKQSSIFPPSASNSRQGSGKIILLDQLTGILIINIGLLISRTESLATRKWLKTVRVSSPRGGISGQGPVCPQPRTRWLDTTYLWSQQAQIRHVYPGTAAARPTNATCP